ncbi:DEAD/DEAH box helicase [Methylobacterium flocculans]|uniref:DEAD/DEAH box helicase n=1 Tax=Methylobacterium flocculans TaxID=2984843 RepID=UPI0021F2FE2A|nr:hypothetical protein [Methylobacterium sp. FF17]
MRPYQPLRVTDLERVFEATKDDRDILDALLAELGHRTTPSAEKLRTKVEKALANPNREPGRQRRRGAGEEAAAGSNSAGARPSPPPEDEPTASTSRLDSEPPPWTRPGPQPTSRPVRDRPEDILSAWTALEVLSPMTYRKPADMADGDQRRIADITQSMPWQPPGERARPQKQLFYQVVLGAIRMDEATNALLSVFVDKNQDRRGAAGLAAIATVTLDKAGVPVAEGEATAISSFAWGLPLALRRDLVGLGRWPEAETRLNEGLDRRIRRAGDDGKPVPLDGRAIRAAFDWLVSELGLHSSLIEPPSFAMRVYHYWMAQDPPDAPLLGSFYLEDLASARRQVVEGKTTTNLRRYLGIDKPKARKDVLADDTVIAAAVAPARFPIGRWPAAGRHPLVLLQQGAVNLAMSDLEGVDLFPVNGPPGTGKTTLLRDMVASLVVRRAGAMCGFDDPEKAFPASGYRPRIGTATVPVHRVDLRLRGFEMLVASSNNKAVENVSRELPALKAIADDATGLRYFKTVADNVSGDVEAWGLIAAVLGNASNRFTFREAMWIDPDKGLRAYLAEAAGSPQWIEEPDPADSTRKRRRRPVVVERENPPRNRTDALKRWREARTAFTEEVTRVRDFLAEIEAARKVVGTLPRLRDAVNEARRAVAGADAGAATSEREHREATDAAAVASQARDRAHQARAGHAPRRPGLLARVFRTTSAKDWATSDAQLSKAVDRADAEKRRAFGEADRTRHRLREAEASKASGKEALRAATAARDTAEARVKLMRTRCGTGIVDAAFFARDRDTVQKAAPWLDMAAHRQRDRVFELALALHKAFIDAAAEPIRSNLENLFKALIGRNAWQPKTKPHMPDLWATLFLVVPVVSTTFASVTRMLGYLPPETLGWLLVDEAGQAVPQAAIGAITRTRRAVVVGDPLQIEPVTSLPTELSETICADFGIDPGRWNAPKASVQAVADASATYVAEFRQTVGSVRVGFPLLVHRRCADPMFTLSNEVAYQGLMVHATPRRASVIRDVLGGSHWVDVTGGRTEDKWSDAEGVAVIDMLRRLSAAEVPAVDLYVISPFLIVAQRLRERITAAGVLSRWTMDPYRWTRERVGTIHTVQGREADSVILVLGAPMPTQRGARGWAGGRGDRRTSSTSRRPEPRRTSTSSAPARPGPMPACSAASPETGRPPRRSASRPNDPRTV